MNEHMTSVLPTLSDDLRPAATALWEQASAVTDEVTETLAMSYRILRQVRGEPALLESGADVLASEVTSRLSSAREDIDRAYPEVERAWTGGGARSFAEYIPRLSAAIQSAHDSASATADALGEYRRSMVQLWSAVIEKTEKTGGEVVAAVSAANSHPLAAVGRVIDIVDDFADYVEELAESLTNLTGDVHSAGLMLNQATQNGELVADEAGPRLPAPSADAVHLGGAASVDTDAMTNLTAAINDNAGYWQEASRASSEAADAHLVPDAFGLGGSHFYGDVQNALDRNRQLYLAAERHMSDLAEALRAVGSGHIEADEELAEDLRRTMEDD